MPATTNVLFNALMLHRGYMHEQQAIATPATLPERLKRLGNSQMDIYYGHLEMTATLEEVLLHVPVDKEADYLAWLGAYREITLSDTSRWVLLAGNSNLFVLAPVVLPMATKDFARSAVGRLMTHPADLEMRPKE